MTQQTQNDGRNGDQQQPGKPEDQRQLSFLQTMLSVVQASFGVQSSKNKQRDFEKGSLKGFIAAALIFTILFVLTLAVVVNIVLS
jgi:hypothetical protein